MFVGEMVSVGQPIVIVMDLSNLIAKIHLSPEQAVALKPGDEAVVKIPGEAAPVDGQVTLISPALDTGSTTLEVWVAVPNRDGKFKVGTSVQVSVSARTVQNALCIPDEALIATKTGDPAVMVIGPDGIANQKPVKAGITDGRDTEILSGLGAGDQVVTKGAYGMDDGTKVKIAAAGAADDEKPSSGKAGGDQ